MKILDIQHVYFGLNRHRACAIVGRGMTTATLKRPGPVTLPHCPCHPSVLTIKLPGRPPATRRPTPDRSHAALQMPHRQNRSPARQNHDYHRQNRAFRPHTDPTALLKSAEMSGNERDFPKSPPSPVLPVRKCRESFRHRRMTITMRSHHRLPNPPPRRTLKRLTHAHFRRNGRCESASSGLDTDDGKLGTREWLRSGS